MEVFQFLVLCSITVACQSYLLFRLFLLFSSRFSFCYCFFLFLENFSPGQKWTQLPTNSATAPCAWREATVRTGSYLRGLSFMRVNFRAQSEKFAEIDDTPERFRARINLGVFTGYHPSEIQVRFFKRKSDEKFRMRFFRWTYTVKIYRSIAARRTRIILTVLLCTFNGSFSIFQRFQSVPSPWWYGPRHAAFETKWQVRRGYGRCWEGRSIFEFFFFCFVLWFIGLRGERKSRVKTNRFWLQSMSRGGGRVDNMTADHVQSTRNNRRRWMGACRTAAMERRFALISAMWARNTDRRRWCSERQANDSLYFFTASKCH